MLGSPVDLTKVDVDAYLVAGVAGDLCAWQPCCRSAQLLGGGERARPRRLGAAGFPPTEPAPGTYVLDR